MLEKGKISARQMGMLLPTVLASGFLILPTTTSQLAHNDLWLTSLPALLVGLLTVYAATRLHELYPKMTVIQYSERLVGKMLGKMFGIVYIFAHLLATGVITRQYADFVTGTFLFKTPLRRHDVHASALRFCRARRRGDAGQMLYDFYASTDPHFAARSVPLIRLYISYWKRASLQNPRFNAKARREALPDMLR